MDTNKTSLILNIIRFLDNEKSLGEMEKTETDSIDDVISKLKEVFKVDEALEHATPQEVEDSTIVREEDKITAELCKNRGNVHMKDSNWNMALKEYTKAIDLNPKNPIYYSNRAAAFIMVDEPMNAIVDCKIAIKHDPEYSKAYARMGSAYWMVRLYKEASEAYSNALKYDPSNEIYREKLERVNSCNSKDQTPNDYGLMIDVMYQLMQEDSMKEMMESLVRAYESTSPALLDKLVELGTMWSNKLQASNLPQQQVENGAMENQTSIEGLESLCESTNVE